MHPDDSNSGDDDGHERKLTLILTTTAVPTGFVSTRLWNDTRADGSQFHKGGITPDMCGLLAAWIESVSLRLWSSIQVIYRGAVELDPSLRRLDDRNSYINH